MKSALPGKALLSIAVLAAASCLAPTANAVTVGGVALADQVSAGLQPLYLNGAGVRTRYFFDVYTAALYTSAPSSDAQAIVHSNQPRRIQLTLLRTIDSSTLLEALDDGLSANNTAHELARLDRAIAQFRTIMSSAGPGDDGDTIELDFDATGVAVSFKERALGRIQAAGLPAALMRVWLGDKPAQASLKQALLGRK